MKGSHDRMSVLFGTVEFFNYELYALVQQNQAEEYTAEKVNRAYYLLKEELLNDFVCDESIRYECLLNLEIAYKTFMDKFEKISQLKVQR